MGAIGELRKFRCICNTYDDELAATAAKATAQIKELSSKIEEETAEKGQLEEELKSHKKDYRSQCADKIIKAPISGSTVTAGAAVAQWS